MSTISHVFYVKPPKLTQMIKQKLRTKQSSWLYQWAVAKENNLPNILYEVMDFLSLYAIGGGQAHQSTTIRLDIPKNLRLNAECEDNLLEVLVDCEQELKKIFGDGLKNLETHKSTSDTELVVSISHY